jgi:hypothetical protein
VSSEDVSTLEGFRGGLIGLPLSHFWRGYGSAIFLEFGHLTPRTRRSGEAGNARGEFGLMIEWSWRIENTVSILCGSWSQEQLWKPSFDLIHNKTVVEVSVFGRLPEVSVALSDGLFVSSFMTAEGDPSWVLFDRRASTERWLSVREGSLLVKDSASERSSRSED